ncbi:aquaporin-7 isoform X2 [Ochotona princeps]|uniref:aquaporin-7 isoform X2 n=1 Tax=Ochotona princeps TaxID=9978 RepID=UPI002714E245|nr:aquaporin-7 isoform X2 [Ochotona princeps]
MSHSLLGLSRMVSEPVLPRIHAILQKETVREFLAEFLSTYVMMVFGLGSVAHMVLDQTHGSYLGVNIGFGFGVTMGVHVAGNISGAHMNAAVTFASCALGRMSWRKYPVYVLGQFLGSFTAAATIYGLFYRAILHFSGGELAVTGPQATAGIFATYLPEHMTLWWGFLNEVSGPGLGAAPQGPPQKPGWETVPRSVPAQVYVVLTGMLQFCILAITDKENNPALPGTQALVTGILVTIIGVSLGMNTGYAINPSRDLPPRFFTFIAGWGTEVFRASENWWWVPVVAPPMGAYIGGIVHLVFIGSRAPQESQGQENSAVTEDHGLTALPKTSSHFPVMSINTPSVQPIPTVTDSMPLESF